MPADEDKRLMCKYGASCYQKNAAHHAKYKHPEKRNRSPELEAEDPAKKQKTDKLHEKQENNSPEKEKKQNNDGDDIPDEILSTILDQAEENTKETKILKSPETDEEKRQFIKDKFLVDMPDDFYQFWDLCKSISKQNPKEAFKEIGLTLVGPYDILDNSFEISNESDDKYLLHWRYYYDPPEFQTIIKGDVSSGYHMGYFRDSPEEKPVFVGSNEANKNCVIELIGENIFGAINTYIENLLKTADPFKKMSINKLHKSLTTRAKELKLNLNKSTSAMQGRHRKQVCKSFHQAGIVVPYNRKTELGYRTLPVDEKELKKILLKVTKVYDENKEKAFTSLHPILTAATIANDECDFGTGLELGLNLFCYGSDCLNNTALNFLRTTYTLLNRHAFVQIAEAHLKNRKKGIPFVLNSKEN